MILVFLGTVAIIVTCNNNNKLKRPPPTSCPSGYHKIDASLGNSLVSLILQSLLTVIPLTRAAMVDCQPMLINKS